MLANNFQARPVPLPVEASAIPAALKQDPVWVVWNYQWRANKNGSGGKFTKPPLQPNGGYAKADSPQTWVSFETACKAYQSGRFAGIGLVLRGDIVGIDLDHVYNASTGEAEPWADEIMRRFAGGYMERSPGGDGVRILCRGKARQPGKRGPGNRLEVYDITSPRYLTITGQRFPDSAADLSFQQAALDWLHAEYWKAKPDPADDSVLLDKARNGRHGDRFRALFDNGETGADASAADLSLCNDLAYGCDGDAERIDRLFRASALMRDKWDHKHASDGRTYGQVTLDKALAGYEPRGVRPQFEGTRSARASTTPPMPAANAPTFDLSAWDVARRFDAQPPARQWLVEDCLPLGKAVLLAAAGGVGKSFLTLDLAYRIATYTPDPWQQPAFTAFGKLAVGGSAVMLCAEDDAIEVHNRIAALGERPAPGRLTVVPLPDAGGVQPLFSLDEKGRTPMTTPFFRQLAAQLKARPDLRLIALDPLQALCGGLDLNLPQHAQHVCGELAKLAADTGAVVLVTHHFRKGGDIINPEDAREAVRGSGGLVDGVRAVLAVWPDNSEGAESACKRLGVEWERNRVCKLASVKANFRADLSVKTLVRSIDGLLVDRSFDLGQVTPRRNQIEERLIEAIADLAREGKVFTKTGRTGIHQNRHELPALFHDKGRDQIEAMLQGLLNAGRLMTFKAKSGVGRNWLDIPGGVLSKLPCNNPSENDSTAAEMESTEEESGAALEDSPFPLDRER